MKIKRYFAADMRQAIRLVREDQGPDAVILSNRRVSGGIEIIAAIEYDESLFADFSSRGRAAAAEQAPAEQAPAEVQKRKDDKPAAAARPSAVEWTQDPVLVEMRQELKSLRGIVEQQLSQLAWKDFARANPMQARLLQRLTDLGLSREVGQEIVADLPPANDQEHAWRLSLAVLAHRIEITDDDILNRGGVVSLVGATGVGKTTMVAKLAARFALRHGKRHVALVSTDSFRIGAHEQLLTYGQILGVPVYSATDAGELRRVLADLADKRLVLIDTAGMSQRDLHLSEQLATLEAGSGGIRNYLVLSCNAQTGVLKEVVQAFRRTKLHGCILTKLDETANLGGALSAVVSNRLPVAYVGDGQRVPEDVHPARAHTLVGRAVALMSHSSDADMDPINGNMANAHV